MAFACTMKKMNKKEKSEVEKIRMQSHSSSYFVMMSFL